MKILQFYCPNDPPATELKECITEQANIWSRLTRLSSDPDYVTAVFSVDTWKEHTTRPGLWWVDYGSIHAALGDDGRMIANHLIGSEVIKGALQKAPFNNLSPESVLELVEIDDLVAAGYMANTEQIVQ
jgi:hypothetical protein